MISPVLSSGQSNAMGSPMSAAVDGNQGYAVQQGDTLAGIARQHGVSLEALLAANPQINNPNVIYVGDQINVPASNTYTVQAGDNLTAIAERFGTNADALARLNGIDNPNRIYVGDVLRVPDQALASPTDPTTPVAPVLERGSNGVAVTELQSDLTQLGYRPGPADGQFGPRTEQALQAFQSDFGLTANGVADGQTQTALEQVISAPETLARGAEGGQVSSLQRGLSALGYPVGPVDGQFGPQTESALRQFQTAKGLTVTGVADQATLAALRSGQAQGPSVDSPITPNPTTPSGEVAATWDPSTDARIQTLHPSVRAHAADFVNTIEAQLGVQVRVSSGLRTFEEQTALYNQGRTTPGNIVTNARAGSSYHNYGLAFDVVPILNGQPQWNSPHWDAIGDLGKQMGFEWGGDFRSIVDKPHFQLSQGSSTGQLLDLYNAGQRDGPYVRL